MPPSRPFNILFDTNHREEITLEEPKLSQLRVLLEENGFEAHSTSLPLHREDFSPYQVIVLGNPLDSTFSSHEISTLEAFVHSGGGLLALSGATIFGKGGDAARNSNLNAVLAPFGLRFSDAAVGTDLSQSSDQDLASDDMITAMPSAQHPVVSGINHVLFTTATSVISGEESHHLLRASGYPGRSIIAAATGSSKGRILAIGGTTPFFDEYIETKDHFAFIVQAFRWLANAPVPHQMVPLKTQQAMDSVEPSSAVIEELRTQLHAIEEELHTLKHVIHTSLKEMEKVVRQVQRVEKEGEEDS